MNEVDKSASRPSLNFVYRKMLLPTLLSNFFPIMRVVYQHKFCELIFNYCWQNYFIMKMVGGSGTVVTHYLCVLSSSHTWLLNDKFSNFPLINLRRTRNDILHQHNEEAKQGGRCGHFIILHKTQHYNNDYNSPVTFLPPSPFRWVGGNIY